MARTPRIISPRAPLPGGLVAAARVRVIYGDTDRMGIVYHGTYLRFLEQGRVERMRSLGVIYSEIEATGYGFPVTDVAVSYFAPARYDDIVTVHVAVTEVRFATLRFAYHLTIEPGDRKDLETPISVLRAETRHCCLDLASAQPTRFPEDIHKRLAAQVAPPPS